MEPPAKRLRILQSVEVDETNPDYIAAKQKQQQKFKGRLESLFAKYEGMHESMSDEIDFKTGQVVVDRGHIRRVQRQMKRKQRTLLDSLLEPDPEQSDISEEEEDQAESEDELAPTQVPRRKGVDVGDQSHVAPPSKQRRVEAVASPASTIPTEISRKNALQAPGTPNPAASLLQHVQFPQTPLGQQAQAAFYANLNQEIAQAVQRAVAPLLSSVFQTTPSVQIAQAPIVQLSSLPAPATDNVRPATDPKWYFPPMASIKDTQLAEHQRSSPPVMHKALLSETNNRKEASSPLVSRRRSPRVHIQRRPDSPKPKRSPQVVSAEIERPHSTHALSNNAKDSPQFNPSAGNSPGCQDKPVRPTRKRYHFTEEDTVYIIERRQVHNESFKEIQASKEKWSGWPHGAFYNHWKKVKDKRLHLQGTTNNASVPQCNSATPPEHDEHFFSSKEIPETSSASHHLPTPSSLGQSDTHNERAILPSSSHFDDDELELLSLAGDDNAEELLMQVEHDDDDDAYPSPDEALPSIEGAEFRNEDELQLEMLKTEESEDEGPTIPKALPSTIPETQDSVVAVSTSPKPKTNQKTKPKPKPAYRAASNSDDDLNLIGAYEQPATPHVNIKRESHTPQASRFLCSSPAFKTPRQVQQSSGLASSGAKSTGKLDRKAYMKEVKQSWAKPKTTGPKSVHKRRSLDVLPTARKRAWAEVGDSEDELAA